MRREYSDTTVIIPTYNEVGTIGRLSGMLAKAYPGIRIIVSDDGSTDGTIGLVRRTSGKGVMLLDRKGKGMERGLTGSVVDGILMATTKYVVVMDGDLQHPPEIVEKIRERLAGGRCKLVVGVRERVKDWALYRRLVSKSLIYACYLSLVARNSARCGDVFSGYFGCDRTWISSVIRANRKRYVMYGYKVLYDTLKCMRSDETVCEVGYTFGARKEGASKAGPKQVAALIRSVFS